MPARPPQPSRAAPRNLAAWLLALAPLLALTPAACRWNSRAFPACGNGRADFNEPCDGTDLRGATCESLPGEYTGGALACTPDCLIDESACFTCTTCIPTCGDGIAAPGELCDGADLAGQDCTTIPGGWIGGVLSCAADCSFDTTACAPPPFCGDGVRQDGEACDGPDLGGNDCTTLGGCFGPGPLACATDCTFDTSACPSPPPGLATARDLNGDGYADFAIGALLGDGAVPASGTVVVYFGCPGTWLDLAPAAVLEGSAAGDRFGAAVAIAGDLDDDGYDDLVVGAPESDSVAFNAGSVYVYRGGPGAPFDPTPDLIIPGAGFADYFGTSVAGAGDLNGDGVDDLIVGALGWSMVPGSATVYFGSSGALDAVSDGSMPDPSMDYSPQFGGAVSACGDLDGDGYGDAVVGANQETVLSFNDGRAYVYAGAPGATFDGAAEAMVNGFEQNDAFGISVAGIGDFDGDAFDDLVVGAYQAGGSASGEAYLFRGGPGPLDPTVDATFVPTLGGEMNLFGIAVHGAGDVNGDGFSDVVVGAYNADSAPGLGGQAYVFFGGSGPTLDVLPDGTLLRVPTLADDAFGATVAGAGDVNGDGYADVLVGAPAWSGPFPAAGEAFLFLGGPGTSFDDAPDWSAVTLVPGDGFGVVSR